MDNKLPAPPETPLLPPPVNESPAAVIRRPRPRPRRHWGWLLLLLLIAAGIYFFWPKNNVTTTGGAVGYRRGKGGRGGLPAVTPIIATEAKRGDIGVYDVGLGAVTPIYTVTVKTRVDGQLMQVYYKEGDVVQKGQPLAEIDARPFEAQLTQYEGTLAKDQALLANARLDLARYQTLVTHNAVPEQQVATQQALIKQYEGQVKTDQGLIESAKVNIAYCHIVAPITGRIGLRLVDPGNIVHASDTTGLLVITQIQPISVIFTIAEDQLAPVLRRKNSGQALPVDAFDRDNKTRLAEGRLVTIDNQIDQSTGTVKLRADFNNRNNVLFPNQFVNARLLVQEKQGVTLLATPAIQRNSTMTYVYLVKPDSTVTVRPIQVGATEDNESEIVSGLNPGDVVVMTGVDKLEEGSKVIVHMEGEQESGARAPHGKGRKNPGGPAQ